MITCQEADVLAAALSVGSLDGADEASLQQHLVGCTDCRQLAGEYMEAASRLPLALDPLRPSPELRSRLMRAVYAEAAAAESPRGAAAPRPPWWQRFWSSLPAARGFTLAAGAAAVALVGLTTWSIAGRQNATPASLAVALTHTPAAPDAHGQLVYDKADSQAVLTVSGLPGPARVGGGASVYEVWLVRADGSTTPAAFLTQAPDGSWTAAMHGDMAGYTTVAATVEPPGGSKAPTGVEVLQASLTNS